MVLIVSAYALSLWKARWNSCGGMVALQLVNVKTEVALFSVRAGLATLLVDSVSDPTHYPTVPSCDPLTDRATLARDCVRGYVFARLFASRP